MKDEWIKGSFKTKMEYIVIIAIYIDDKVHEYYGDYLGNKI
jgi:hypothetical protein